MVNDQIGDLLTRIRNATKVGHLHCQASYSNLKKAFLDILQKEGYILGYHKVVVANKQTKLTIDLKYKNNISVIQGIKRISKPGLRIYVKSDNLPTVLEGIGIAIISTSQGLMTNEESKKCNSGGEVLAHVW